MKGNIDKDLGSGSVPFLADEPMPSMWKAPIACYQVWTDWNVSAGVLEKLLSIYINPIWTNTNGHRLNLLLWVSHGLKATYLTSLYITRSEVELRFTGNVNFDPAAATLAIKDFFTFYSTRQDRHLLESSEKSIKAARGTFLCVDFYIRDDDVSSTLPPLDSLFTNYRRFNLKYYERLGDVGRGKRSAHRLSTGSSSVPKRQRSGMFKATLNVFTHRLIPFQGLVVLVVKRLCNLHSLWTSTLIFEVNLRL